MLPSLMAEHHAKAIASIDDACRDDLPHLEVNKLLRKIALLLVRMEKSPKTAEGVRIADFALYVVRRQKIARKEFENLIGVKHT